MEQVVAEKTAQKAIAHANEQYNGDWDAQIQQAITTYDSIEVAQQTSYRQDRSQSQYDLEMGLIAFDASLADAKDGVGQSFHTNVSLAQSNREQSRAALDSVYALFEKMSTASALSAAQGSSPWMANDAAKAVALANWYGVMAPAKAAMDGTRAIAYQNLENAYFGAQSQWIDRELPDFRQSDKQRAFQRASEIAALRQNPVPDPSLAPDLVFYSGIVQGTLPVFVSRGFTQTQSGHFATAGTSIGGGSYGMGYGGGYGYGGTSILNPNGTPSGFGLDGLGSGFGSSESFGNGDTGSPTSRVSWDLIGEADAIQSEDNANALIDLYFVSNDGLRSILDSAETANDQGNGGGSQGYGGNGGGDGYGSGEGGGGGSSAAELSAKKRVLDFNAFKLFLGKIDPAALKVFEDGGGRIERRGAWIPWTETSVAHRGTPKNGDLTFWIDENWSEFDAAIRVAQYIAESRTEVRGRYDYNTISDPRTSVEAAQSFRKKWYKDAAEMTEMGVSVYLGFLSIANEGIDLIVTVEELSKGNWAASIGLLPFIPAGGAVRIVDKLGNSKLISNEMMHKISKLGDTASVARNRIQDSIPSIKLASNADSGRGILGWVKPSGTPDSTLKAHYLTIAKSKQMETAVARYNSIARILGQNQSATIDEIVATLGNDVTFTKVGHLRSGAFVPGEHSAKTTYWLQGKPTTWYGQRVGRHELLHIGAALRGQKNTIRHEIAVQLATTPENLVLISIGLAVVIGPQVYWLATT